MQRLNDLNKILNGGSWYSGSGSGYMRVKLRGAACIINAIVCVILLPLNTVATGRILIKFSVGTGTPCSGSTYKIFTLEGQRVNR